MYILNKSPNCDLATDTSAYYFQEQMNYISCTKFIYVPNKNNRHPRLAVQTMFFIIHCLSVLGHDDTMWVSKCHWLAGCICVNKLSIYDDVTKWTHFLHYWSFVTGIHLWQVHYRTKLPPIWGFDVSFVFSSNLLFTNKWFIVDLKCMVTFICRISTLAVDFYVLIHLCQQVARPRTAYPSGIEAIPRR